MTTERGVFVSLEGGEGTGKTTQMRLLKARLAAMGIESTVLREPGGTALGDKVRELLLTRDHSMCSRAELLLYEASRAELINERIIPALHEGGIVLLDRFCDSTIAYQGVARGLGIDAVEYLNHYATDGLVPDLTICLDIDPVVGIKRATGQGADRIESEAIEFHHRVRAGFLAIALREPKRFKIVDASGTAEEVHKRVLKLILPLLQKR